MAIFKRKAKCVGNSLNVSLLTRTSVYLPMCLLVHYMNFLCNFIEWQGTYDFRSVRVCVFIHQSNPSICPWACTQTLTLLCNLVYASHAVHIFVHILLGQALSDNFSIYHFVTLTLWPQLTPPRGVWWFAIPLFLTNLE